MLLELNRAFTLPILAVAVAPVVGDLILGCFELDGWASVCCEPTVSSPEELTVPWLDFGDTWLDFGDTWLDFGGTWLDFGEAKYMSNGPVFLRNNLRRFSFPGEGVL